LSESFSTDGLRDKYTEHDQQTGVMGVFGEMVGQNGAQVC